MCEPVSRGCFLLVAPPVRERNEYNSTWNPVSSLPEREFVSRECGEQGNTELGWHSEHVHQVVLRIEVREGGRVELAAGKRSCFFR